MSAPTTQTTAAKAPGPAPRWSDHEVDQVIGRLLQLGVLVSTVVVLIGAVLLLLKQGSAPVDFTHFAGAAPALRSVSGTIRLALAGDPFAIIQAGLVLLIATPIARVALTLVAFVVQRDRLYVGLTAVVLIILLVGLL